MYGKSVLMIVNGVAMPSLVRDTSVTSRQSFAAVIDLSTMCISWRMKQNRYIIKEFFTDGDLRLLHEYGDKVYAKTPEADVVVAELSEGVWAKTNKWSNLVVVDGFRAECLRYVVKQAGRTQKQADGRHYMRRVFRPYSWAKLYRPAEKGYGIFFTVGVDGKSQSLMWKLDCKRAGSKALDPRLVQRFDEYLHRNASTVKGSVSINELRQYDWDKLVEETRQFIIDNLPLYEAVLAYTWQGSKPEGMEA